MLKVVSIFSAKSNYTTVQPSHTQEKPRQCCRLCLEIWVLSRPALRLNLSKAIIVKHPQTEPELHVYTHMHWNISMVYSDGLYALTPVLAGGWGLEVHSMPVTWSAGMQRDAEKVLQLEYINFVRNTSRCVCPTSIRLVLVPLQTSKTLVECAEIRWKGCKTVAFLKGTLFSH